MVIDCLCVHFVAHRVCGHAGMRRAGQEKGKAGHNCQHGTVRMHMHMVRAGQGKGRAGRQG